jgi:hypothetical protein
MFSLADLSEEDAIDLVSSLLAHSIPPTAIAKALAIDADFTRSLLSQLRTQRYGTAEISEAMTFLMWKAYDEAIDMLQTSSPAIRLRTINMILSRSVGMASRQDPEEFERLRKHMESLISLQRETGLDDDLQPGEFVLTED